MNRRNFLARASTLIPLATAPPASPVVSKPFTDGLVTMRIDYHAGAKPGVGKDTFLIPAEGGRGWFVMRALESRE